MTFEISEIDRAYTPMIEPDHLVQTDHSALNWTEAGLYYIQGAEKVLGRIEKETLRLELGHNLLGPVGGAHLFEGLKRIGDIWQEESDSSSLSSGRPAGLSKISINRNRLSNDCLPAIAAYLDGNLTMTTLNLAANVLHEGTHMKTFGQAIANSNLRDLNLNGNPVTDDALVELFEGLHPKGSEIFSSGQLEELELQSRRIGPVGGAALGDFLADNKRCISLCKLGLHEADLDWDSFIRLYVAIGEYNCGLTTVALSVTPEHALNVTQAREVYDRVRRGFDEMNLVPTRPGWFEEALGYCEDGDVAKVLCLATTALMKEREEQGKMESAAILESVGIARILLGTNTAEKEERLPLELRMLVVEHLSDVGNRLAGHKWSDIIEFAADRTTLIWCINLWNYLGQMLHNHSSVKQDGSCW